MRTWYIDNAKAIGIILVVVGHHPGLPEWINRFIFSFHIPLFFFISGCLLKENHLESGITVYLKELFRKLVLPYLFFSIISYAYWLLTFRIGYKAAKYSNIGMLDPLSGILYGIDATLYINVVLWFFTCLFMIRLIHFSLRKIVLDQATCAILCLFGIFISYWNNKPVFRLPWSCELAIVGCVFYALGHRSRQFDFWGYCKRHIKGNVLISIFMMGCMFGIVQINGRVDTATMNFGNHPILYFAAAFLGIYVTMFISIVLGENRLSRLLSKYSIVIFPVHLLLFSIFNGIGTVVLHYPHDYNRTLTAVVLQCILAIGLCIPISSLAKRYVNRLIPIE